MKKILGTALALLMLLSVAALAEKTDVNVFVLTGPTGIGAANL